MQDIKSVILAGGNGTRLWPVSRETSPKQFAILKELGGVSLYQLTLKRALKISKVEDIYIIVSENNYFHAEIQAEKIGINLKKENIIIQYEAKESLPIMLLASKAIESGNILTMPCDHLINDNEKFSKTIKESLDLTKNGITAFGITPDKPETGFGYIEYDKNSKKIIDFHEKPDEEKAIDFIKKGFVWNSGIYLFDADFFKEEASKYAKDLVDLIYNNNNSKELFEKISPSQFEFVIAEKSKNMCLSEMDLKWSDLGSFDSIGEYIEENEISQDNIITAGDTKGNIIINENNSKEIALIDVSDIIVVDTPDALLITKRGSSQKVKEISKKTSKKAGIIEYRPWGSYEILSNGNGYKTKKVVILPGKSINTQSHKHRSEHWVIVEGTGDITINGQTKIVPKGESLFVEIGETHKVENNGKIPLIIIESQIGDYLGEDDTKAY